MTQRNSSLQNFSSADQIERWDWFVMKLKKKLNIGELRLCPVEILVSVQYGTSSCWTRWTNIGNNLSGRRVRRWALKERRDESRYQFSVIRGQSLRAVRLYNAPTTAACSVRVPITCETNFVWRNGRRFFTGLSCCVYASFFSLRSPLKNSKQIFPIKKYSLKRLGKYFHCFWVLHGTKLEGI